jgi:hypothetical protein
MRAQKKQLTARPKSIPEDVAIDEPSEEGLSVEPEEMGQSFLRYATEQGTRGGSDEDFEPALVDSDDDESDEADEAPRGVAEIDLTESVIDEASLLDEESDVLGEVIPKQPRTEDGGRHKSRGR